MGRKIRGVTWALALSPVVLLLMLLAAWVWIVATRPPPVPTLAFIGYTNKPLARVTALVLFRNQSRVPVEVLPQIQNANVMETNGSFFSVPGFHWPFPTTLPEVVRPGKIAVLDINLNYDFREPWWTEVCTRPRLKRSRVRDWAAKIQQPTLRQLAQRLFPPVHDTYTKLGPFTNLPPGWMRGPDGSAWRRRAPK